MLILLILGVLIGGVSVIFALQNIATINVAFLFWHVEGSLSVILLLAIVAGMLVSALVSVPEVFRDQMKLRAMHKRVKELEAVVDAHRSATTSTTSINI